MEKIKISLQKTTLELLKKDCLDFKFLKESGTPNFNAFINQMIINYYEEFSASEDALHGDIKAAISIVPEIYKQKVFSELLRVFARRDVASTEKKDTAVFSFKPTKFSEKSIIYIEHILVQDESLSSFYRRMFTAYSKKNKTEREKIIFKETYTALQTAIKSGKQVCITLQNGQIIERASVYSVSAAKDELFNYVLAYSEKNHTLRLAKVRAVILLPETSQIPEPNLRLFEKQVACAAQYPIYSTDAQPIKVQLTEKGKKLFEKIYLYRPEPLSIDGDIYTFDCSANQLIFYFKRFGENALILSPKKLGIFMRNYHYYALKKYETIYHDEP